MIEGYEREYEIAGRRVRMPCVVRDASAGTATFEADADAARALVPPAFEVVETAPGRCHVTLAIIDYRDNDLGDYDEVGITFFVRPAGAGGSDAAGPEIGETGLPAATEPGTGAEVGTYIHRLPVDQAFTCEAGRRIWGFPKTVEDIALLYADRTLTATLLLGGELAFRLTVPRGGTVDMAPLPMVTYTLIDGVPHVTAFSQGGSGSQVLAGGDGVALELGEHPVAKELAALGLPSTPLFTTWTEHMRGTFEAPRPLA
jgi:hypothetical protein